MVYLEAQDNEVKDITGDWTNAFESEGLKGFGVEGKIIKGENGSTKTEGS